jgi:glycosyltransferase involved in cell wall biosynthesis
LGICLAAIEAQTYPREAFEIVVGDNNSHEGKEAVKRVIGDRARLAIVRERGPGPARNGAVALASGDVLAFTDSDCRPDPHWLSEGITALRAFDFVGGNIKVSVDDEAHMTPVEAFERVFAFRNEIYVNRKKFTAAANMFCPRAVFDAVGRFNSDKVSEDKEWCHRAGDMGYRIGYRSSCIVYHPARRTWDDMMNKLSRMDVDYYRTQINAHGGRLKWLAVTLALPLSALVHTPRVLFSRNLNSPRQRLDATMTLYRQRWRRFLNQLQAL